MTSRNVPNGLRFGGHHAKPTDNASVLAAVYLLFRQLSVHRRRTLLPLLALMLVGAVAELFTLGALLPFLAVLANAQNSPILAAVRPLVEVIGATSVQQVQYALTGLFALAALISSALRLALLWATQRFVYGVSSELGVKLYSDALFQPYSYHIQRNTSEIIASISKVEMVTTGVLMPLMTATVAMVIAIFIVTGLVVIDPSVALVAGVGCVAIYLLASLATRSSLHRNSGVIAKAQGDRVRSLQEGLGGIRDVLIDQSQPVFIDTYKRAESCFRDARTRIALVANAPRFIVEGGGMVLIALVAVTVASRQGGFTEALPVLGALALGAQRLLPLVQQIYVGWASTAGNKQNLIDVVSLVSQPEQKVSEFESPLPFFNAIKLDNVGYSYAVSRTAALQGIFLEIPKGARVGIVGKTGSGKSTLVDVVIGLLEPSEGEITVDGVILTESNRAAWRKNVAHVPQAIFLADASITENIAFGVGMANIDMEQVRRAAEQAELAEVISKLPDGYDTRVGERGIQLSGGQRQRIGIARALYKQAAVLVFDEATSALDYETESAVMSAIQRLDRSLTILIIAHRVSTLESCDVVVRLDGGRLASEVLTNR